jgi:hypothetical protein
MRGDKDWRQDSNLHAPIGGRDTGEKRATINHSSIQYIIRSLEGEQMHPSSTNSQTSSPEPFRFTFTHPYESFVDGKPALIPYLVDGLLPLAGLSILGGKPKSGKSSLSRYLATCVTGGKPFLGRDTQQGDVILINLEDPSLHLDNCLKALGYDLGLGHGRIYITDRLPVGTNDTLDALRDALARHKGVRLVIIDHLAKLLRLRDLSDYMPVQEGCQRLRDVARQFPTVHLQALAHCKKVQTDDPFDQILGSTALRGEPDTNMVIFQQDGERAITSETRIGRAIPPTLLTAEVETSAGADVVSNFSLGMPLDQWRSEMREQKGRKQEADYGHRVIKYLQTCNGTTALQQDVLHNVTGKTERVTGAINQLIAHGVLKPDGSPRKLTLISGVALDIYMLGT